MATPIENAVVAIEKIMYLRQRKTQMSKEHKLKIGTVDSAIDKLTSVFIQPVMDAGMHNIPTSTGTAILNSRHAFKAADRAAFLAWVKCQVLNDEADALEVFSASMSKEFLDRYLEENNDLPPGIEIRQWEEIGYNVAPKSRRQRSTKNA